MRRVGRLFFSLMVGTAHLFLSCHVLYGVIGAAAADWKHETFLHLSFVLRDGDVLQLSDAGYVVLGVLLSLVFCTSFLVGVLVFHGEDMRIQLSSKPLKERKLKSSMRP